MADTGSFPIALQVPPTAGRPSWTAGEQHHAIRLLGGSLFAIFLLGAGSAAAGLQLEAQGYGSLILVGGVLIGVAAAVPAWLLFRRPGSGAQR